MFYRSWISVLRWKRVQRHHLLHQMMKLGHSTVTCVDLAGLTRKAVVVLMIHRRKRRQQRDKQQVRNESLFDSLMPVFFCVVSTEETFSLFTYDEEPTLLFSVCYSQKKSKYLTFFFYFTFFSCYPV